MHTHIDGTTGQNLLRGSVLSPSWEDRCGLSSLGSGVQGCRDTGMQVFLSTAWSVSPYFLNLQMPRYKNAHMFSSPSLAECGRLARLEGVGSGVPLK